ncbi:hypothetical protein PIB30_091829 [Stylosanthes scabra]|uniref:Uncharacterized protein n=1 Tax=Stylosanthes scabra TaxID=79078 RepID=A0ABU6YVD3_9FABA|nr:hypothetical protein [Stylosanthes scabra]
MLPCYNETRRSSLKSYLALELPWLLVGCFKATRLPTRFKDHGPEATWNKGTRVTWLPRGLQKDPGFDRILQTSVSRKTANKPIAEACETNPMVKRNAMHKALKHLR